MLVVQLLFRFLMLELLDQLHLFKLALVHGRICYYLVYVIILVLINLSVNGI